MKGFGARLKAAREARGLSQLALARLLPGEVSQGAVSYWESDRNTPSAENLRDLCQVLGCSADGLLGLAADAPRARGTRLAREIEALPAERREVLEALTAMLKPPRPRR